MATSTTSAVSLRVYDLSRGMARQLSPALLGKQIDGIWHTGVLVYGKEYFYGGGIQVMAPELVVARYGMPPVQVVPLGTTSVPIERFERFLREISPRFTAATYDLLANNCNNFSNELATFLLGSGIPQHILDLPNEALSTPLGAMLRPMIESLQREMNATGAQPFAIPFNDASLATADVAPRASETPSLRFKVSGTPTLHLERIVARICALNAQPMDGDATARVLSTAQLEALRALASRVTDAIDLTSAQSSAVLDEQLSRELWAAVRALLARGPASPLFFPALGVFRVLLLLPVQTPAILTLKTECFDQVLLVTERSDCPLSDAHTIALLSVLVNGFANPFASELVLARAVRILPFAFAAIADARPEHVRVLGASLISNCCLALQIEEEVVITTVICGAVETLDRIARDHAVAEQQQPQTVAGVVAGVARLVRTFQAARSLSVELGLPDVLRRLSTSSRLASVQPLVRELETLM